MIPMCNLCIIAKNDEKFSTLSDHVENGHGLLKIYFGVLSTEIVWGIDIFTTLFWAIV